MGKEVRSSPAYAMYTHTQENLGSFLLLEALDERIHAEGRNDVVSTV
jgi:hypothetical protein